MKWTVIVGVIVMVLSYGLGIATPWLRAKVKKTDTKIDDIALELAINTVKFVDKAFNGDKADSKKQRAMDMLEMAIQKVGIKVDVNNLAPIIEKAVTTVKVEEYNKKEEEGLVPVGE